MEFPRNLAYLGSVAQVDETILKAETFVTDLYTYRNSLVPINARLPKEILCEIFLHLARGVYGYGGFRSGLSYKWIEEVSVCRHWRNIALEYPRLWTQIAAGLADQWLDVLLARSKQAPLTIVGPYGYSSPPIQSEKIFPHLHRVRHLHIHVPTAHWERFHTCLGNASMLETLWLSSASSKATLEATAPLPRIRCLKLSAIMPHGLVQPTLISLRLKQLPATQSVAYWISLLQGLPLLQDLEIEGGFHSQRGTALNPSERAYLPNLRRLTLVEVSEGVGSAEFLQHIDCPTFITMIFQGLANIDDETYYDHIHRVISAKTYHAGIPSISCCMDDGGISWAPKISFRLWSTPETMDSMAYAPENLSSQPRVTVAWIGRCLRQASYSFLQSISLPHLRTLCFDAPLEPDDGTWSRCLAINNLRELRVMHRDAVESLVRAFCDSRRTQYLFPLLDELTISHISWYSYHPDDPHKPSTKLDLLLEVHRMLLWRKGLGLPVKRLDIDEGRNLGPRRMTQFAKDAEEQELLEVFEWSAEESMSSGCSTCESYYGQDSADEEEDEG